MNRSHTAKRRRHPAAIGAVALAAMIAAAASAAAKPAGPPAGSWAGTLSGARAFIAIVIAARAHDGVRYAAAYVCDGQTGKHAPSASVSQWFLGPARSRQFTLTSNSRYRLTITLTANSANGTLKRPNERSPDARR
ncbi:MAG TPA: hypothetical protein VKV27_08930 [Solirubrobacteraceae bacterium]|nr:hypothetical protein [Solirubrobacteraceae bacterium]